MNILKYYELQLRRPGANWPMCAVFTSFKAALATKEAEEKRCLYGHPKTHFRVVLYTGRVLTKKVTRRKTLKNTTR